MKIICDGCSGEVVATADSTDRGLEFLRAIDDLIGQECPNCGELLEEDMREREFDQNSGGSDGS